MITDGVFLASGLPIGAWKVLGSPSAGALGLLGLAWETS
jgi:hypothetical protein